MNHELYAYIWCICWVICGYIGYCLIVVMEQKFRNNGRVLFSAQSSSYLEDALKHFVICIAGPAWIGVFILISTIFLLDGLTTKKRSGACQSKNDATGL